MTRVARVDTATRDDRGVRRRRDAMRTNHAIDSHHELRHVAIEAADRWRACRLARCMPRMRGLSGRIGELRVTPGARGDRALLVAAARMRIVAIGAPGGAARRRGEIERLARVPQRGPVREPRRRSRVTLRAHAVDDRRVDALLGKRSRHRRIDVLARACSLRHERHRRALRVRPPAQMTALAADAGRHLLLDGEALTAARAGEELLHPVTDVAHGRAGDALLERIRAVAPRTALGPWLVDLRVRIEVLFAREPRIEVRLRVPALCFGPPREGQSNFHPRCIAVRAVRAVRDLDADILLQRLHADRARHAIAPRHAALRERHRVDRRAIGRCRRERRAAARVLDPRREVADDRVRPGQLVHPSMQARLPSRELPGMTLAARIRTDVVLPTNRGDRSSRRLSRGYRAHRARRARRARRVRRSPSVISPTAVARRAGDRDDHKHRDAHGRSIV